MLLFRTKINIVLLALSLIGSHLNAADAGYVAQAKQKARNLRDWSAQVTKESCDKARKKANDAYVFACEKTRVLREKVKENKSIAGALAYLAVEGILKLSGSHTLFGRIFLLPGELNTANTITIPGLQNTVNGHLGTIANFNNVIIPNLNADLNIANIRNQNLLGRFMTVRADLDTANANLKIANNTINDHCADLDRSKERLMNVLDEHNQEQQKLNDQLNRARLEARQVQQQQAQPDIAALEPQNGHDKATFAIVAKNFLEQSKDAHIAQGKAQLLLDQKYDAIVATLNNVNNELQSAVQDGQYQAIDAYGIINDLIKQEHEFVTCQQSIRELYGDQQDEHAHVQDTFATLVNLTQQTINHVISQINDGAEWVAKDTNEMNFAGLTADNFDEELARVHSHIHNYFTQMNTACDQLNWIVELSHTNATIKFCLDNCDNAEAKSNNAVQVLGAMLVDSLAKVEQLLRHNDNNCFVDSYDDAFNLYAHSLVVVSAYESYSKFCSMLPNSDGLSDWARPFEQWIAFINNTVLTGGVHLKDEPFNGMNSILGNSVFMGSLHNSMSMLNNSGLDRSAVNNLDLSVFLTDSINPVAQCSALVNSLKSRSGLGTSSLFASTTDNSVDDIDALLQLATEKSEQDWEDELNAMDQSIYNSYNSSVSNANNSLTLSNVMANSLTKSVNVTNSINLGNSINLANSMSSNASAFVGNASIGSCPFVPAEAWTSAQARLDQSSHFDNRGRYSRVPNFGPINGNKPRVQNSVLVNKNNNTAKPKPATRAVGNLVAQFETDGLVGTVKSQAVKRTPKYTLSNLINELGESTPPVNEVNGVESGTFEPFRALLTMDESTTTATTTATTTVTNTNEAHPDGYHSTDYYSYTGDDVDSVK